MHENDGSKVYWRPKHEELSETIGRIKGNFHEHEAFGPLTALSSERKADLLEYALDRVLKNFADSPDELKIIVLLSLDCSFQKGFVNQLQRSDAVLLSDPEELKALLKFIALFQHSDISYLERKSPVTVALEKIAFTAPSNSDQKEMFNRRTFFIKKTFYEEELGKFEDPKYDQDCVCIWEATRLSRSIASQCCSESIRIFKKTFEAKGCDEIKERFYHFVAHAQKSSHKNLTPLIDFALSDCETLLQLHGSNTPHDIEILESQSFLLHCLSLEALVSTDKIKQALAPSLDIRSPHNFLLLAEIARYELDDHLADNILYHLNARGSPFWKNEQQYRPLEQMFILAGTAILLQVHNRAPEDLAHYLSDQLIAFKDHLDPRNIACKFDRAMYAKLMIEILLSTSSRLGRHQANTTFHCLKSILLFTQDDLNQEDFHRIKKLYDTLTLPQLSEITSITKDQELKSVIRFRKAIESEVSR